MSAATCGNSDSDYRPLARGPACRFAHAGYENLLQWRMRRRQQDGRVHLFEETRSLPQENLPGRILHRVAAGFGARVQAGIGPDMTGLVWLPGFGGPQAHDL